VHKGEGKPAVSWGNLGKEKKGTGERKKTYEEGQKSQVWGNVKVKRNAESNTGFPGGRYPETSCTKKESQRTTKT